MSARNGADLLVQGFEALGLDAVFGLPGTQLVAVFESLRRRGLRVVVPTHEMAAGFMAMGYARASERPRPGVVLTIPGPGFTYALTALAEAKLDAVPLIHVTLAPARSAAGAPGFQAVDQTTLARPLVKEIIEVRAPADVAAGLSQSAAVALEPPVGPVLLHLSQGALGDVDGAPATEGGASAGERADWSEVLSALRGARHPVVVVAGDFDARELAVLAARDRVPVCVTPAARGAVPDDHLWGLTFDDQRTSLPTLNAFLSNVDLCLVLGGHLSHVATAGYEMAFPERHMIWVRPAAGGEGGGEAHFPRARKVSGDPQDLLLAWRSDGVAAASRWTEDDLRRWRSRLRNEHHMAYPEPKVRGVPGGSPEQLFAGLAAALPREAIVVTDSGLHQVLARRYLQVQEPRGLIFPTDFQSMGFGIPAGLGAQLAAPARPVVALVGDGGFLITGLEMLTAVKEQVPLVVVVFNDGQLNLIRLHQIQEYGREHGVRVQGMDYAAFAEATGIAYRLVDGDPAAAMREALDAGGPALVEVRLGDTVAVDGARARSLARETARALMGRSLVRWLKRMLP